MRRPARPGLWLVATREYRFFRRDRAGYLLVMLVPLIAFAVLTWTFSSAVVRGLNVVLIDDVLTSGATANAASRALLRAGAKQVDVLVFARVVTGG